ncbi:hypothetical protein CDAR_434001 [Caerostris darwini]|uniref:Uncharacterized protein n=1 Tax=Caerostris darwini TaxID=1538125 RepID=A0AAV4Q421_9ARAC|nr:hypothetical protein CDAR_434001 [Caerostris darwini]
MLFSQDFSPSLHFGDCVVACHMINVVLSFMSMLLFVIHFGSLSTARVFWRRNCVVGGFFRAMFVPLLLVVRIIYLLMLEQRESYARVKMLKASLQDFVRTKIMHHLIKLKHKMSTNMCSGSEAVILSRRILWQNMSLDFTSGCLNWFLP